MKTDLLASLLLAIVGRIMADEGKEWLIWLNRKIRRLAVAALPAEYRKRYDEEWENGLDEVPGELLKLLYSLGLLQAATGMRRAASTTTATSLTNSALLKRFLDVMFSGIMLVWVAPVMLLIAIAIKATSRGPVVYISERMGRGGRSFKCMKFRSLAHPAGGTFSVTQVGRFLRKHHLDELPQLVNVLVGDMSLVGPPPKIPGKICESRAKDSHASSFAPGLTGPWQLTYLQDPSLIDTTAIDEWYKEHSSMWIDLKIIWQTITRVFISGSK